MAFLSESNGELRTTHELGHFLATQTVDLLGHPGPLVAPSAQLAVVSVPPGVHVATGSGTQTLSISAAQGHTDHLLMLQRHHLKNNVEVTHRQIKSTRVMLNLILGNG